MHKYLYATTVTVQTEHQPTESNSLNLHKRDSVQAFQNSNARLAQSFIAKSYSIRDKEIKGRRNDHFDPQNIAKCDKKLEGERTMPRRMY